MRNDGDHDWNIDVRVFGRESDAYCEAIEEVVDE
jgi:hypothetical protein